MLSASSVIDCADTSSGPRCPLLLLLPLALPPLLPPPTPPRVLESLPPSLEQVPNWWDRFQVRFHAVSGNPATLILAPSQSPVNLGQQSAHQGVHQLGHNAALPLSPVNLNQHGLHWRIMHAAVTPVLP